MYTIQASLASHEVDWYGGWKTKWLRDNKLKLKTAYLTIMSIVWFIQKPHISVGVWSYVGGSEYASFYSSRTNEKVNLQPEVITLQFSVFGGYVAKMKTCILQANNST